MNKIQWNGIMFSTIFFMVAGFVLAILGLYEDHHSYAYVGITMMSMVCVTWWFWVMFVIKDMFLRVEKAADKMGEVKEELGTIRQLINSLFSPPKR